MTIQRSNIVAGPGILTFDSQVIYSADDIIATPNIDTFMIPTSMYADVDERLNDILWEIALTPSGQWKEDHLSVLWPHTNPTIGSSIFGATDKNVVINSLAGQKMTFKAGAVTGMPDIILSAHKTAIGQLTLSCIGADNTAWSDTAKRSAVDAEAFSDTSFDPDDIKTVPYTSAWGNESPWDSFDTEDGWTISFELATQDITVDSFGIVDRRITGIAVIARCVPQGISESQLQTLLKIQGSGIARGVSLSGNAKDLVIDGGSGNPKVTINNAAPKEGPFRYGQTVVRAGEVAWVAVQEFNTGARQAIYAVEISS